MVRKIKLLFVAFILLALAFVYGPSCCSGRKGHEGADRYRGSLRGTSEARFRNVDGGDRPCADLESGKMNPMSNDHMSVARTASGNLDSGRFGRTRMMGTRNHDGIDLEAEVGTPVYAMCDGVVDGHFFCNTARNGRTHDGHSYGNRITINSSEEAGTQFMYAHLDEDGVLVKPGEYVRKGQLIGYTGQTGNAWGKGVPHKHLHLEIRRNGKPVDPEDYLNGQVGASGDFVNIKCD